MLLSLVVCIAMKSVGVLLMSAFMVIPACASRRLSRPFTQHVALSAMLGAGSTVLGMLLSALANLLSGPSIVMMQLAIFGCSVIYPRLNAIAI